MYDKLFVICPSCQAPMLAHERPENWKPWPGQKTYFARWFTCRRCYLKKYDPASFMTVPVDVNPFP